MTFEIFDFSKQIVENIGRCGYAKPTPIQQQAIPPILAGRDCVGLAQTGTGKTAAFVLPLLEKLLKEKQKAIRALIIAPTRELAEQIHSNVKALSFRTSVKSAVVYGGVGRQRQLQALRAGADIVVACPGRLLDLIGEPGVSMAHVNTLVLDEADHMFDQGFLPDIKRIIRQLPPKRQNLVFSATMPGEIRRLIDDILIDAAQIKVQRTKTAETIEHAVYTVPKSSKTALLKKVLSDEKITGAVIFTRTKYKARNLAVQLGKAGYKVAALQGNMSQQKRKLAMDGFRDGTFTLLVATDIAARGIDVSAVSHVINYDIPDTVEAYTHRTGRTGRAEKHGLAISFVEPEEMSMIARIERKLHLKIQEKIAEISQQKEQPQRQVTGASERQDAAGNVGNRPRKRRSRRRRAAPTVA